MNAEALRGMALPFRLRFNTRNSAQLLQRHHVNAKPVVSHTAAVITPCGHRAVPAVDNRIRSRWLLARGEHGSVAPPATLSRRSNFEPSV
jgi:hypothetical protein